MPTESEAEQALEMLRATAHDVYEVAKQARLKSHMLKHVEGYLVIASNQPVTIKKESARAQARWKEAAMEDAEAHAQEQALKERRDTSRITISLFQTMTKDRL